MKDFESLKNQFPNPDQSVDPDKAADTSRLARFSAASMERFELLSAYLDGEVTANERRQVQEWLDTDPEVQKWYRQLTRLQHSVQAVPTPVSQPSEQLSAQVFQKLDRKKNQRLLTLGGAVVMAIAAGFVVHLSGGRSVTHQMAQNQSAMSQAEDEALVIALNRPVFDLTSPDGENYYHK